MLALKSIFIFLEFGLYIHSDDTKRKILTTSYLQLGQYLSSHEEGRGCEASVLCLNGAANIFISLQIPDRVFLHSKTLHKLFPVTEYLGMIWVPFWCVHPFCVAAVAFEISKNSRTTLGSFSAPETRSPCASFGASVSLETSITPKPLQSQLSFRPHRARWTPDTVHWRGGCLKLLGVRDTIPRESRGSWSTGQTAVTLQYWQYKNRLSRDTIFYKNLVILAEAVIVLNSFSPANSAKNRFKQDCRTS